jgi:hypothetical protein
MLRGVLLAALAGCVSGFIPTPAFAAEDMAMPFHHHNGDLLLFPNITGTHLNTPVPGLSRNELMPELNIFYSTDHGRLRFLGEFLLNRDEQEMERLQLGWLVQPTTTLWLGRFHNPLGFWNTEHHHGTYLQTTISRPSIINFEDEGGVLPTHVVGLLGEGTRDLERGYGSLNYAFALVRGPNMESGLDPMNILELRNGGKLAASARLSYRTQDDSGEFGGFAGYTRIPVVGASFDEVEQSVAGVFFNRETETLRLVGEVFYIGNRLQGGATRHADFSAAYLQAEYRGHPDWTLFGRLEGSHGTKNNAYLDLVPDFLNTRIVAGVRFEVASHQALKLELSHNERQDDARYNQLSLQWSMVYP